MFSQASEYALRALTELARCKPGDCVLTQDIADFLDVPVHYLGKILQTLTRRGILESQRGRFGGFRLARDPREISAYDVVAELDDMRKFESCILGETACSDEHPCPFHTIWTEMRENFLRKLRETTMMDLAVFERPGRLTLPEVCSRCKESNRYRQIMDAESEEK